MVVLRHRLGHPQHAVDFQNDAHRRARRHVGAHLGIKNRKTDGIALFQHHVGDRCGEKFRVFQLADLSRAVGHRGAGIDQDVAVEIRLRLVEFGEIFFRAAEHAPVDGADRIAGRILAVMRELGAEAAQRTAVAAHPQALHDLACDQFKVAEFLQHLGIEILRFWQVDGHGIGSQDAIWTSRITCSLAGTRFQQLSRSACRRSCLPNVPRNSG